MLQYHMLISDQMRFPQICRNPVLVGILREKTLN